MPGGARSGWRRAGAPLIVGLFLLITTGLGILDMLSPMEGPALTDKAQAERRRERGVANVADGSSMRYLDRELQERSNLRYALVPWYIAYALLPMREGGSGVVVGKDGWLFLKDRVQPRGGTHRPSHARMAANILTAFDRRVAALGIETLFLPLPRKATIVTPYLPEGTEVNADYEREMLRLLRERRIPHVNLYDVWEGMDPRQLWQREDTHWSPLGMWHALDASARALREWVAPEERLSSLEPEMPRIVKRQLLFTLGIPNGHPALYSLERERLVGPVVRRPSLRKLPNGDPAIVLLGTSFTDNHSAERQLSHMTNRRVLNLSRGGTVVGITLDEALNSDRIPEGASLLLEVPAFQLQGLGFGSKGPELLNSQMMQPLSFAEPPAWSVLAPIFDTADPSRCGIPARTFASSADGIAHLELTGRAAGNKTIRVTLMSGGTRLIVRWLPGVETLHIPIVGIDTEAPAIVVQLPGVSDDHSIQMHLVTELDLEHAVVLQETAITSGADGWQQERPLPANITSSRHAALSIDLAPDGPAGRLEVELIPHEGRPHPVAAISLTTEGSALLSLSAAAGTWKSVRIKGTGEAPERVGRIRIADLPAH